MLINHFSNIEVYFDCVLECQEERIKHLEMAQAVINRLGRNSFLLKSWGMTILVAAIGSEL